MKIIDLVNIKFVSYGLSEYNPDLFNSIKNTEYNIKPSGGLWTSPKNSDYGWIDFCRDENYFKSGGFRTGFEFQLKPNSKVYIIDTFLDLIQVPYKIKNPLYSSNISFHQNFIDYEEMSKEYDAIWLTDNGEKDTRLPEMYGLFDFDGNTINLYGWDCESLLILRKDCIINTRNLNKEELPIF